MILFKNHTKSIGCRLFLALCSLTLQMKSNQYDPLNHLLIAKLDLVLDNLLIIETKHQRFGAEHSLRHVGVRPVLSLLVPKEHPNQRQYVDLVKAGLT